MKLNSFLQKIYSIINFNMILRITIADENDLSHQAKNFTGVIKKTEPGFFTLIEQLIEDISD